jgi:F420-dependent oxidoreductase-like protein
MRFSLWPVGAGSWSDLIEVARLAEDGGWDGVYVADHFMGDAGGFGPAEQPTLEATAMLAGLATATSRVRLGSLVLSATYRHPAVLANWAATVDHASGGRLVLGLGAGWQENEHEQYGLALGSPGERLARLDEHLQVVRDLLNQPTTNLHGTHYRVTDALCEPKPLQAPLPILVGGKGDRMLRLVARHADEWNMWSTPAAFAERSAALDAACELEGRDPATIRRSTQVVVLPAPDPARAAELVERLAPRPAVAGTAASIAEQFAAYRAVGVDELIVPTASLGTGAQRADFLAELLGACTPLRG